MPLPALPILSDEATEDEKLLMLALKRLYAGLEDFTPSQQARALDLGGLGTGPGSPLDDITLPTVPPIPDTPIMDVPIGFYRQIVSAWNIDVNPFITGWEVQRASNLAFTTNVSTRTTAFALMYVDEGLLDNATWYYRIRALTKDTTVMSPFCAPQSATTLANDTGVLTSLQTAAVLIQRAHIHNLVVDTAKIANASILTAKIADLAVSTAKIAALAVTTAKIDDLGVTTAKIANLAVTNAKINDLAADKITAGTISVLVQLTNQTIKLDGVNSQITITDTQGSPVVRIKLGKLSAGASDYGLICYDATGQVMFDSTNQGATQFGIKDLEVITGKLNDLAVATGKIGNNAVTANVSYASTSVGFSRTATSYANTGGTASITTTGAPVLILVSGNVLAGQTAGTGRTIAAIKLVRDTTDLREAGTVVDITVAASSFVSSCTIMYLDTPAAGAHTYKIQGKVDATSTGNPIILIDKMDIFIMEIKK